MSKTFRLKSSLFAAASAAAVAAAMTGSANALPVRDDVGVDGAVDTDNVWGGVGMMWNRTPSGTFVCTGQLINPRTVVWAAHCVDGIDQSQFGGNQAGGVPIGFGFQTDSLPGYFDWRDRGLASGNWSSNTDLSFFNVLQVQAPFDLDGEFEFPGGDVSLATLDTPAIGLPTYGMLFSPITESTAVSMVGYGGTGIGSGANQGIDGKRRAGTNMLDGLFSQTDFLGAAFGVAGFRGGFGPVGDQLLYNLDFDRPDRDGTCARGGAVGAEAIVGPNGIICDTTGDLGDGYTLDGTSVILPSNSIDWYPGEATEREAGTLGGDSGGGLFVEIGGRQLVTGVLSGGWVAGLASPSSSIYGDVSYYNPLFLFQNWIAEQNPYVYVTAAAGDGNWSDGSHWTRALDPNYLIVNEDGELVNGMLESAPETPTDAVTAEGPYFGTIFDTTVDGYRNDELFDAAGDASASAAAPTGGRSVSGSIMNFGPAQVSFDDNGNVVAAQADAPAAGDLSVSREAMDTAAAAPASPQASAPSSGFAIGSSNFVPNNDYGLFGDFDGALSGDIARFYDVTLAASGTTTVDMNVEIDRLNIAGAGADFHLQSGYFFSTLIATDHSAGRARIDGVLMAREYMNTGGVTYGSGLISTQTYWNVAGMVTGGDLNAIGTLGISGDYVQTAAGMALFDWDGELSDTLLINGDASLGGLAGINPLAGYIPTFGDRQTVITHSGERVGEFDGTVELPGVLYLAPIYGAGSIDLEIRAQSFSAAADLEGFSAGVGAALDASRGSSYNALSGVYQPIDLLGGETLSAALTSLAPSASIVSARSATAHVDAFQGVISSRFAAENDTPGSSMGSNAMMNFNAMGRTGASLDAATLALQNAQTGAAGPQFTQQGRTSVYVGGGTMNGDLQASVDSEGGYEGGFALAGVDYAVTPQWRVGGAVGMADTEASQQFSAARATTATETTQGTLYAAYDYRVFSFAGYAGYANSDIDLNRSALVGGGASASFSAETMTAGLEAAADITGPHSVLLRPAASLRYASTDVDGYTETGGPAALTVGDYTQDSLVGRVGFNLSDEFEIKGAIFEPAIYVGLAHEFNDDAEALTAGFNTTPGSVFAVNSGIERQGGWGEIAGSLFIHLSSNFSVGALYEKTSGRDYLESEVIAGSIRVSF